MNVLLSSSKIMQHKAQLKLHNVPLDDIVGRPDTWGRTNEDGSILVFFQDRANPWHRYIYYSGNHMVARADDTNVCFVDDFPAQHYIHVTNAWYWYVR